MRTMRARTADIGLERSSELGRRFGRELRVARVSAGLTQAQLGRLAGVTQQEISRTERGDPGVSLDVRCRLVAGTGHELGWRLYPVATVRLRDSGQLAIAQTLVAAGRPPWSHRLEAPVAPADLRAVDILFTHPDELAAFEIERALVDFQAQLRSAQLKRDLVAAREGRPVRLVIAVPDNLRVRERIAPFADLIGRALPVSSRRVWQALRTGRPLGADGLVFVRRGAKTAS